MRTQSSEACCADRPLPDGAPQTEHSECSSIAPLKKFAWNFATRQQVHRAAGWVDDCVVQAKAQGVVDDRAEVFDADFA